MTVSKTTPFLSAKVRVYATWQSLSEESGLAPAYMIGLAGCDRSCSFCHARHEWERSAGEQLTHDLLVRHFELARELGCCSLQFTGGEPCRYLEEVVSALPQSPEIPLVLNTSLSRQLHLKPELLAAFALVIVSLKFGRDVCSRRMGCGADYIRPMRQRLAALHGAGIPLRIRHLVMPGHLDCCLQPTLDWLAQELPAVPLTILMGFIPPPHAQVPELCRTLTAEERHAALAQATGSGVCWEVAGEGLPTRGVGGVGPEYVDIVIDSAGAICLPTVGPAALAFAAGLGGANEEEIS